MNLHDAGAYDGYEFGVAWFVALCDTCGWWGAFLDWVDAERHAARHFALTAKGDGR